MISSGLKMAKNALFCVLRRHQCISQILPSFIERLATCKLHAWTGPAFGEASEACRGFVPSVKLEMLCIRSCFHFTLAVFFAIATSSMNGICLGSSSMWSLILLAPIRSSHAGASCCWRVAWSSSEPRCFQTTCLKVAFCAMDRFCNPTYW